MSGLLIFPESSSVVPASQYVQRSVTLCTFMRIAVIIWQITPYSRRTFVGFFLLFDKYFMLSDEWNSELVISPRSPENEEFGSSVTWSCAGAKIESAGFFCLLFCHLGAAKRSGETAERSEFQSAFSWILPAVIALPEVRFLFHKVSFYLTGVLFLEISLTYSDRDGKFVFVSTMASRRQCRGRPPLSAHGPQLNSLKTRYMENGLTSSKMKLKQTPTAENPKRKSSKDSFTPDMHVKTRKPSLQRPQVNIETSFDYDLCRC